ncbi:MAG: formate dehydrogenase [Magnetovibrio sp.]|nr:formate dehydrogenase [Magnetovibrio sp.]|tara:strand:- start:220 stop:414 length:195 start_codon:yes stop_codon:yes gene_type:complete
MKKSKTTKSRRDFLKAAGLTGAAAGVAAVALSENQAQAAKPDNGQKAGYRETEHVKTYYELARF